MLIEHGVGIEDTRLCTSKLKKLKIRSRSDK